VKIEHSQDEALLLQSSLSAAKAPKETKSFRQLISNSMCVISFQSDGSSCNNLAIKY
jgi:hypothetical protein